MTTPRAPDPVPPAAFRLPIIARHAALALLCCALFLLPQAALPLDWTIEVVESTYDVGTETCIALDSSGNPHIIYRYESEDDLHYAWKSGGIWSVEEVDTMGLNGQYPSLTIDASGTPHACWGSYNEAAFKYGYRDGSGDWNIETVETIIGSIRSSSIALYGGDPVMAYQASTARDLKIAWHDGMTWQNGMIASTGDVGTGVSLKVDPVTDKLTATHYNQGTLNVEMAEPATMYTGWTFDVIGSSGSLGGYVRPTSLAFSSDGTPHVTYYDDSADNLVYAKNEGSVWDLDTVDVVTAGVYNSLAIDAAGNAHIAYYGGYGTAGRLRYATNKGGTWSTEIVDDAVQGGHYCSIALDADENVHISYYDNTGDNLRYAFGTEGPRVWHVPSEAPTIQAGIDSAQAGDTVIVACDTYHEHDIIIQAGVVLTSATGDPSCVTIDADSLGRVFYSADADANTRIEGFTLTGGNADNGGAIYLTSSSPTIHNCVVTRNHSDYDGGGISCWNASMPVITQCVFSYNDAGDDGGAVMCRDASALQVEECLFIRNSANDAGGGLYCYSASPNFERCTFSDNAAGSGVGGGMSVRTGSAATFDRTIIAFSSNGQAVHCSGGSAAFTCSDIFGNDGGDWTGCIAGQDAVNNNLSVNPIFCDRDNDEYGLNLVSPIFDDPACGRIGYPYGSCDYSPACSIVPPSFDLGTVRVGEFVDYAFTITNTALGALEGDPSEACAGHTILSGGEPFFLGPGESREVTVHFEPPGSGNYFCSVGIDGQAYCSNVPVSAWGGIPDCQIDLTDIDFGVVRVGETKDTTFTISNLGSYPISGNVTELCDPYSIQSGGGPFILTGNMSRNVTVRFAPTEEGVFPCTIETGTDDCVDVACTGQGAEPACTVSATAIDFGRVGVGASRDTSFVIRNDGALPFSGDVTESCDGYSVAILAGSGPFTLEPGESLVVNVSFEPPGEGAYPCTIATGTEHCGDVACIGEGDYPECEVFPQVIDFGVLRIPESRDTVIAIQNVGLVPFGGFLWESCDAFSFTGLGGFELSPGDSHLVEVTFEPFGLGVHACVLNIDSDNAACLSLEMSGTAAQGECTISPESIDFGYVAVSDFRDTSFVIVNDGLVPLVGEVSEACAGFTITEGGGVYELSPGESLTVGIRFQPDAEQSYSCPIETGDMACVDVSCSGWGAQPVCSVHPASIDFGDIQVGEYKDTAFTIDNNGPVSLVGTIVPDSDRLTVLSGESYNIGPGEGHTVTVRWSPGNTGGWYGTVDTGDDACEDVSCTGQGYVPACLVSPGTIDFGAVAVGDSADTSVVVANVAAGVIEGSVGADCPMYSISSDLPTFPSFELFEGDSFHITVRFRPTGAGSWPCSIDLGSGVCSDISCSGTGAYPSCSVTPATLDFGEVAVGDSSDSAFTITNTGSLPLECDVDAPCPMYRLIEGGGPLTIDPGGSARVMIRFTPTSPGDHPCTVETGDGACADVSCTGTGAALPSCAVEPDTVLFGAVALGESVSASFTIRNAGGQALTGEFATGCGPFTVTTADRTFDLAAGASKLFGVRFVPAEAGTAFCVLPTIDTNAGCDGPLFLGVAVTEPVCSVTPALIDLGTLLVGEEVDTVFSIRNAGSGVLAGTVLPGCGPFLVEADNLAYTLGPGDDVSFALRFSPDSAGTYSCSLDVGTECALLVLAGSAEEMPLCEVVPDTIDFGELAVGEESASAFTITNRGGGTLAGSIPEECGMFTCGVDTFSLGAGESMVVPVRFAPSAPGVWTCNLAAGGEGCGPVHLAGHTPALCLVRPDSILFEPVPVGARAETTFTLRNVGGALLEGEVAPGCGEAFFLLGERSYALGPGEEEEFILRFAPEEGNLFRCDVDLGMSCGALAVSGVGEEGPSCQIFPTEIRFHTIPAGEQIDTSFTITNGGGGSLTGTVAEGCGPFHLLEADRSYSLATGETAHFSLRYAPTGPEAARCTLSTGAACSGIALFGAGEVCAFALTDPIGGEAWPAGGERVIRWTSAGAPGEVRLDLLRGGVVCDVIVPRTADDGVHPWQVVPCGEPGGGFQVRVAGADDEWCADTSDGTFAILAAPVLTLHEDSVAYDHDPLGPEESPPPPPPRSIILENTGWGELAVWARPAVPWITVEPESTIIATGTAETLDVHVLPDLLCCGHHVGTIGIWTDREGPPAGEIRVGLSVTQYSPGDCNGDHAVDLVDVALMIDHILEITPLRPNVVRLGMADLNADGATNVADIVRLAHTVAGKDLRGMGALLHEDGGTGSLRMERGVGEGELRLLLEGIPAPRAALLRFQGGGGGEIGAAPLGPSAGVILEREGDRFVLLYYDLGAALTGGMIPAKDAGLWGTLPIALLRDLPEGEEVTFLGGEAAISAGDVRLLSGAAGREGEAAATGDHLHPAYPNPFTRETWVAYHLAAPSQVRLAVFTVAGRLVRTLESGGRGPGLHQALWDGRDDGGRNVAPGMYFLRLETARRVLTRRVTVLR